MVSKCRGVKMPAPPESSSSLPLWQMRPWHQVSHANVLIPELSGKIYIRQNRSDLIVRRIGVRHTGVRWPCEV